MAELSVTLKGKDELSQTINEAKKSLNDFSNSGAKSLGQIDDRFKKIQTSSAPLKRQLRELKAIMADMQMGGLQGTEQYTKIATYAGQIQDAMSDASQAVKRFSDDTLNLSAASDAMQVLVGGATALTGAMNAFGIENDKVKEAILRVQSAMAILNGVQVIANKLNKDSALMQKLKAIQLNRTAAATARNTAATAADTVANQANAASATAATAANTALAVAMKAVPWVAVASLAIAAGAAIYDYMSRTNSASEAEREAARKRQEYAKTLQDISEAASRSAAKQVTAFMQLTNAWRQLSTEQQKNAWIKENQKAFSDLGLSIKGVADAENVFTRNTGTVIKAMLNRAAAAAATSVMEQKMQQALADYNKVEKYRNFKRGDVVDDTSGLVEGRDYSPKYYNGVRMPGGFLTDSGAAKATQRDRERAQRQIAQNHNDAMESIRGMSAMVQRFVDALNREFGILTDSVPQYKGTPTTTTSTTPTRTGKTDTTKTEKKAEELVKGSWEWFQAQISAFKKEADKASTQQERDRLLRNARAMETERDVKFSGLLDISPSDLTADLNEQLKKVKVEPMKIPVQVDVDPVEDAKKKSEAILKQTEGLRTAATAAGEAFSAMASAMDNGTAKTAVNLMGMLAQAIVTMIQGYATATAQAATLGPWAWAAFGLTGLAQLMSMIAMVKNAANSFAEGGIVGGTSYSGDRVPAFLNSGEMVLNRRQTRNLFNLIDSGRNYGGGVAEVQLKVRGSDLYGALSNYNTITSKTRR